MRIHDLSRVTHRWATGQDRSWCARAWEDWQVHPLYFAVLMICGPRHCRASWLYYRKF